MTDADENSVERLVLKTKNSLPLEKNLNSFKFFSLVALKTSPRFYEGKKIIIVWFLYLERKLESPFLRRFLGFSEWFVGLLNFCQIHFATKTVFLRTDMRDKSIFLNPKFSFEKDLLVLEFWKDACL